MKLAEYSEDGFIPFEDFYEACKRAEPTSRNKRWIEKAYCHMVKCLKPDMHNENDIVNCILPLIYDEINSKVWYYGKESWESLY